MQGMNRVFLMGRLGRDPQQYTDRAGRNYVRLNLATERNWFSEENQKKESRTDWHSVTVWGRRAELCTKFLAKGSPVMIEGHLSTYETETTDGDKRWNTSINAEKVTFLPTPRRVNTSEGVITESFEN